MTKAGGDPGSAHQQTESETSATVTSIDDYAFSNTKLTGLDLSEATALTTIGTGAFANTALVGQEVCTPNTCFTLN